MLRGWFRAFGYFSAVAEKPKRDVYKGNSERVKMFCITNLYLITSLFRGESGLSFEAILGGNRS